MNQQQGREAKIIGRRYLFHAPGITYAVTTIVLILGAINGQNNFLFALFGLATGGLVISGILSGANLMGVRVSRLQPLEARVGEQATLRYRISNVNRFLPACAILVEELPSRRGVVARLGTAVGFAAYIPAGESIVVEAGALCRERGLASLSRFRVTSTFPFGLTRKSVVFDAADQVVVYPMHAQLRADPIHAAAGERLSQSRATPSRHGDEFHSLREYVDGDPLRSVAWRASARGDMLLVREHTRRSSGRVILEFDSALKGDALERVISCVAAMAQRACEQGNQFAVARTGGGMVSSFGTGKAHLRAVLKSLALFDAPGVVQTERALVRPRDVVRVVVVPGAALVTRHDGAIRVGADDAQTFGPAEKRAAEKAGARA
ncbi:MAG: DUF58 domain-containing protein [Planctomycetota bacterium]|nr:DUF58 domain-containing protein [Planctomycetota bacterium]